jgi:hypothetical protein
VAQHKIFPKKLEQEMLLIESQKLEEPLFTLELAFNHGAAKLDGTAACPTGRKSRVKVTKTK